MNFVISAILWQFQVPIFPSFFTQNKWKSYKTEFKLLIMSSKNFMLIGWKLAILLSSEIIRIKLNVHNNNYSFSAFHRFVQHFALPTDKLDKILMAWQAKLHISINWNTRIYFEFDFSDHYSNYKSSQVAPIAKCPYQYHYITSWEMLNNKKRWYNWPKPKNWVWLTASKSVELVLITPKSGDININFDRTNSGRLLVFTVNRHVDVIVTSLL